MCIKEHLSVATRWQHEHYWSHDQQPHSQWTLDWSCVWGIQRCPFPKLTMVIYQREMSFTCATWVDGTNALICPGRYDLSLLGKCLPKLTTPQVLTECPKGQSLDPNISTFSKRNRKMPLLSFSASASKDTMCWNGQTAAHKIGN